MINAGGKPSSSSSSSSYDSKVWGSSPKGLATEGWTVTSSFSSSNPVAITVTIISSSKFSLIAIPK